MVQQIDNIIFCMQTVLRRQNYLTTSIFRSCFEFHYSTHIHDQCLFSQSRRSVLYDVLKFWTFFPCDVIYNVCFSISLLFLQRNSCMVHKSYSTASSTNRKTDYVNMKVTFRSVLLFPFFKFFKYPQFISPPHLFHLLRLVFCYCINTTVFY